MAEEKIEREKIRDLRKDGGDKGKGRKKRKADQELTPEELARATGGTAPIHIIPAQR
jgi:hypothetical protein